MADLSKIVCLEQDCRHGAEQTGSSGSGNDTYTKAEIDSKDADIRAAASEAKSAANNAQSVNQTQDGQIKALQEAVDNLHNYEHPAYSAHQLGFYKFANDVIGSVSDAQPVTKKDITDLGIPENDTNTTYELKQHESLYSSWCTDPTVILKGSDGNVSELIVPNTYATFQFSPIYALNRGASINNDKYKTILDLDYFAPNTYNPHFVYRAPIAIDIHVWLRLSGESTRNFRIKICTSTAGDLRLPDMAFIRYSGDYSDVKDIKWTVGIGYRHVASGETAGVASVIRIGVDNDTYNKLAEVNGNASMQYVTSANGVGLNIARSLTEVNDIPVDIIIRPFIDISRDEVSSVALSGDYNDLSNKPDLSTKQDKLTAGTNITISNNVISAKDTTYDNATTSKAGLMSAADKTNLNANTSARHTHSNKATLDKLTDAQLAKLDGIDLSQYLPKSATASAASKLATARKINTVAFDGTKDITIPRSNLYVHAADGKTGTAGYALVATLTVTSVYANMPTIIRYTNRNGLPTELMMRFANVNSKDPTVSTFSAACSAYDDTRYRKAYLNKSASGTWDLYITKSEAYDTVRIIDMQNALGVNVTFKDALITALPSTAISPIFLGTTGWISMTKSSLILGGGIKYRLDNNRITVSGAFSLKQAITASLTGSVLATCDTLDLSGLYSYELSCVAHATYDRLLRISAHDDNGTATITGYPVKASGETIPAYSTFYFTMTGYLDGLSF